jgi:threonine dehydrogenase-like Zn-dependent dehydrogenase
MAMMKRVAKPEGFGNIVVEDAPIPEVGPRKVLVQARVSLISRGSEILRRYMHDEAIDARIMGYSVAGVVTEAGAAAESHFAPGDRVAAVLPHAEYVVGSLDAMEGTQLWRVPDALSFEQVSFIPLCTGAVTWAAISEVKAGDTVVVMGQGLVGNLVLQAVRAYQPGRLIAVDALPSRLAISAAVGADEVINAADEDPVARVHQLTNGAGAQVVIDCVGGRAGLRSFVQAQEMVADGGTLHLIALYHGEPLHLDAQKIQRRRLIGGYYHAAPRPEMVPRAVEMVTAGQIQVEPLMTHRFHFSEAKAAYDLLYDRPQEALGVLLLWDRN